MKPQVTFLDLENLHSENKWRLIASPTAETTFQFSSQTWIYDMKLLKDASAPLPVLQKNNLTCLLYVFKGNIKLNNDISLIKKDSVLIKNEEITIEATDESELVLFVTDEESEIFDAGMYSGNKA